MSTLQKVSLALVGTAVFFMSANPASAVTLTTGGTPVAGEGQYTNIQGATTINLNSGTTATDPNVTFSTTNGIVNGSVDNEYAAPLGDTSDYLTVAPLQANVPGNTGNETITFANPINYFGFYWGSIDLGNSVSLYNGSQLLATYTGTNVPGASADGNQTSSTNNVYVNLLAAQGQTFDKVVFATTNIAFEVDNISYANVPEPTATLGLLAFGVVSAGSLMKRKSKLV